MNKKNLEAGTEDTEDRGGCKRRMGNVLYGAWRRDRLKKPSVYRETGGWIETGGGCNNGGKMCRAYFSYLIAIAAPTGAEFSLSR